MTTATWEFTEAPKPGEPTTETARSPEGAALGREIARLCDVAEAAQRERFPGQLPRCSDCAGRLGTLPNESAETLMDLIKCTMESVPFYCHKGLRDGAEPKLLCSAFMLLSTPQESR